MNLPVSFLKILNLVITGLHEAEISTGNRNILVGMTSAAQPANNMFHESDNMFNEGDDMFDESDEMAENNIVTEAPPRFLRSFRQHKKEKSFEQPFMNR